MAVIHHYDNQLGRFVEVEIPDPEARAPQAAWEDPQPCWATQAPAVPVEREDGGA